ncbi:transposase, partial [Nocardia cyriacigeorgica]|uniref:transposase n=1 Tax=Nocardia cyriacigeorgica TaxID=135487 RepID=UPI0024571877
MTDNQRIDPSKPFVTQLAAASPDLLRELLSSFVHTIMNAEADSMCGADYGQRSEDRVNSR